jgi:poly-beta-1,6-N-acetyl-D-glucosamine synthase
MLSPSLIIAFFFVVVYAIYIKRKQLAWRKIEEHKLPQDYTAHCTVSVLIPYRNEVLQMRPLLADLEAQTFAKDKVQYIFINDHSTDGSEVLIKNRIPFNSNFVMLSLEKEQGKKAALQWGLDNSKGHLIVTIDADVHIQPHWLQHIASFYLLQEPLMIIAPVVLKEEPKYWKKLVRLEWLSLMALTGASACQNRALMCNGANLCVERNTLVHTGAYTHHKQVSGGDDMFTLLAFKRLGLNSVKYIWSGASMAETKCPNSVKALLEQRIRWVGKMKKASDIHIKWSGFIIVMANLSILFMATCSVIFPMDFLWYFLFLFGLKATVDYSLINAVAKKMNEKVIERDVMALSIIYPFYLLAIPLVSLFYKPYWKGRKVTT